MNPRLQTGQKDPCRRSNHLFDQWGSEFLQALPAQRGCRRWEGTFAPRNDRGDGANRPNGNYDAVIVPIVPRIPPAYRDGVLQPIRPKAGGRTATRRFGQAKESGKMTTAAIAEGTGKAKKKRS